MKVIDLICCNFKKWLYNRFSLENYDKNYSKYQKCMLQAPIIIILLYLVFTLILYAFGPFSWVTYKPMKFWFLQISYVFFLFFGYQIGIRIIANKNTKWSASKLSKGLHIIKPLIIINVILIILNMFRDFGYNSLNFQALYHDIIYGLQNMGDSYLRYQSLMNTLKGNQILGGNLITIINYLWEFIGFSLLLFGAIYFNKVNIKYRILIIFTYFIIIIKYASIGTNIGVFRIILIIILYLIIDQVQKRFNKTIKVSRKKTFAIFFTVICAFLIICLVFVNIMKSRGGILNWASDAYNVGGIGLNKDSILFKILPESLYIPMISISSYLTQGYYGFSLCLRLPWLPTYGLGSSMQIIDLVSKYFFDIQASTYQFRINQFGWGDKANWHTIYSWFANDVGLWGVILLMFLIGFCFAIIYKDCLKTKNPFATALIYYFVLLFLFIPCNNQVFQSTYTLFPFILLLLGWLFYNNSYKEKKISK